MNRYLIFFRELWQEMGCEPTQALQCAEWTLAVMTLLLAVIVYYALNLVVGPIIKRIVDKSPTKVDDVLLNESFLKWIWWLIAIGILYKLWPQELYSFKALSKWVGVMLNVVLIAIGTKATVELVKNLFMLIFDKEKIEEELNRRRLEGEDEEELKIVPSHSLQGLQQMIIVVIICLGCILTYSSLMGKDMIVIVSGLGACATVLMLVFKDSILGVVAGVQLTANDMLRPGDWICASKYGANGRVQEVTLAAVKVLNWDHTIITIPPYNLISDSFQNWRKMEETGGRRVMRAFNIDMTSVRFLTGEELDRFRLTDWGCTLDPSERQVNLTVFRRYLENYMISQPTFRDKMLYMVRELAPTPEGLPIEVYFFTSQTTWAKYEMVQANLLDHILAVVDDFGLRLFQSPTGADIRTLRSLSSHKSALIGS